MDWNIPYSVIGQGVFLPNLSEKFRSYKMDLDLWDCLAKFHMTHKVICCYSREGKNPPYSRINKVPLHLHHLDTLLHNKKNKLHNKKKINCFSFRSVIIIISLGVLASRL